ncbi:MAG: AraC family transcriptional regulator [Christiangramia sp.]|nr:AraC family transcriptional regulator [Christiangramia sp.]
MRVEVFIKNMVCDRCVKVLRNELKEEGLNLDIVELGRIVYETSNPVNDHRKMEKVLVANGFSVVLKPDTILVEQVKICLIDLMNNLPIKKTGPLSAYLTEITGHTYTRLSRTFSINENITIEKYFIKLKTEKVKELIQSNQLNFTQISHLLDYSNINHLSRQFKAETGMNLSEYRGMKKNFRNSLDQIL